MEAEYGGYESDGSCDSNRTLYHEERIESRNERTIKGFNSFCATNRDDNLFHLDCFSQIAKKMIRKNNHVDTICNTCGHWFI